MGLFSRKPKEEPKQDVRTGRIEFYKAIDGWRWRLLSSNGKITAESGEAYIRRYDCRAAAVRFQQTAPLARIIGPEDK